MSKPTLFCIVTTARSGSTWLATLLNSHPEIKSLEEPFIWRASRPNWKEEIPTYYEYRNRKGGLHIFTTFSYINLIKLQYLENTSGAVGFKVMYNHMFRNPFILVKLVTSRFKLIHLVRENYLDILISRASAKKNMIFHSTHMSGSDSGKFKASVELEVSTLRTNLTRYRRNAKLIRLLLRATPLPVHEISYEEMAADREKVLKSVSKYLSVPFSPDYFHSELKRLKTGDYGSKIKNYEEVKNALRDTDFEYLLY